MDRSYEAVVSTTNSMFKSRWPEISNVV